MSLTNQIISVSGTYHIMLLLFTLCIHTARPWLCLINHGKWSLQHPVTCLMSSFPLHSTPVTAADFSSPLHSDGHTWQHFTKTDLSPVSTIMWRYTEKPDAVIKKFCKSTRQLLEWLGSQKDRFLAHLSQEHATKKPEYGMQLNEKRDKLRRFFPLWRCRKLLEKLG